MPVFSKTSLKLLETCHPDLQRLCKEVIQYFDFKVITGYRGEEEQNKAFAEGKSKLKFPQSKHNKSPSLAIDLAPYPVDWNDTKMFYLLGGLMIGASARMGIPLRWGGAWDGVNNVRANKFNDLGHFELMIPEEPKSYAPQTIVGKFPSLGIDPSWLG